MPEGYWYCPRCQEELSSSRVTYQELCDTCGTAVTYVDGVESYEDLKKRAEEAERRAKVMEGAAWVLFRHSGCADECGWDKFIEDMEESLREADKHG